MVNLSWIYAVVLLGLSRAKRMESKGFIKYRTVERSTDRARKYSSNHKGPINCAVVCSHTANCDFYLYNPEERTCKLHASRKQVFVPKPISNIHWTVDCGKPPRASHGRYKVKEKLAHYTCNKHFKLLGTNDIRCSLSWPPGPKCLRYIWKNPILHDHFNARIPWGFKEGGSIFLSGRPTLKDKSFVIFIGVKNGVLKFLLHIEVKVSTTQKQEITIHTGSMTSGAITWTPDSPLYSVHNITELSITMMREELKIIVNNLPFNNIVKVPNTIHYENINILSTFNRFKVELLKVNTNN